MHFWAPEIDPSHPMDCTQAERYALKRLSDGTFLAIAGEDQRLVDVDSTSDAPGALRVDKAAVHIATSHGSLDIRVVQPEGKPRMDVASWINGAHPTTGEKLSSE